MLIRIVNCFKKMASIAPTIKENQQTYSEKEIEIIRNDPNYRKLAFNGLVSALKNNEAFKPVDIPNSAILKVEEYREAKKKKAINISSIKRVLNI